MRGCMHGYGVMHMGHSPRSGLRSVIVRTRTDPKVRQNDMLKNGGWRTMRLPLSRKDWRPWMIFKIIKKESPQRRNSNELPIIVRWSWLFYRFSFILCSLSIQADSDIRRGCRTHSNLFAITRSLLLTVCRQPDYALMNTSEIHVHAYFSTALYTQVYTGKSWRGNACNRHETPESHRPNKERLGRKWLRQHEAE